MDLRVLYLYLLFPFHQLLVTEERKTSLSQCFRGPKIIKFKPGQTDRQTDRQTHVCVLFDVWLNVHLSIILAINQLDAQNLLL